MKLKDITTSLELAKELKKAGFPQKSVFLWVKNERVIGEWMISLISKGTEEYAAPTAEELLEWLPSGVFIAKGKKYRTWFDKIDVNPFEWEQSFEFDPIDNDRLVDGLAKMVIYLAKNKIIKLNLL